MSNITICGSSVKQTVLQFYNNNEASITTNGDKDSISNFKILDIELYCMGNLNKLII